MQPRHRLRVRCVQSCCGVACAEHAAVSPSARSIVDVAVCHVAHSFVVYFSVLDSSHLCRPFFSRSYTAMSAPASPVAEVDDSAPVSSMLEDEAAAGSDIEHDSDYSDEEGRGADRFHSSQRSSQTGKRTTGRPPSAAVLALLEKIKAKAMMVDVLAHRSALIRRERCA
jgi:hypothetical protein